MDICNFAFIPLGFLVLAGVPQSAHARVDVCESLKSIQNRAKDEICQYYVSAADACFEKINLRYAYFVERGEETSTKDLIAEGQLLKADYESGRSTVQSYLKEIKNDVENCGDEIERIKVAIEAFDSDLKVINLRLGKLKKK